MKYPITLSDSTPYFEKHFLMIEESPDAYVSAFREAQYESIQKQRKEKIAFSVLVLGVIAAWAFSFMHLIVVLGVIGGVWSLNRWRGQHEKALLDRTFQIAIKDKDDRFQEYMWSHRDRNPLV